MGIGRISRIGRVGRVGSGVGEFTPLTLSGLAAWYDASREAVADDTAISSATDYSGNNRHAVQATGTKQPLFKTAIQNGLGVYRFDGADDFLNVAFTLNQPSTVLLVFKVIAVDVGSAQYLIDGGTTDKTVMLIPTGGTNLAIFAGSSLSTGAAMGTTLFHSAAAVFNGASSSIQYDAVAATTGAAGANNAGGISIGGAPLGAWANCDIGEVIVYSRALSSTEITQVLDYLKTKWGL